MEKQQVPNDLGVLLTPQQVADLLQIPVSTLKTTWRSNRSGPVAHRVGNHLRYRREDVERWLEERRDGWAQSSR
jgi:excisionase family DNA binding protein